MEERFPSALRFYCLHVVMGISSPRNSEYLLFGFFSRSKACDTKVLIEDLANEANT